jgi:hypothetical protein
VFSQDSLYYQSRAKEYLTEVIYAAMESCKQDKSDGILKKAEESGMLKFKSRFYKTGDWEYEEIKSCLIENKGWTTLAEKFDIEWKENLISESYSSLSSVMQLFQEKIDCPYKAGNISAYFDAKIKLIQASYVRITQEENFAEVGEVRELSDEKEDLKIQKNLDEMFSSNEQNSNTSRLDLWHYALFLILVVSIVSNIVSWSKLKAYKRENKISQKEINRLKRNNKNLEFNSSNNMKTNSTGHGNSNSQTKAKNKQVTQKEADVYKEVKVKDSKLSHNRFIPPTQNTERKIEHQPQSLDSRKTQVAELSKFVSQSLYFEEFIDGAFVHRSASKQKGAWSVYKIKTLSEKEGRLELLFQEMGQEIITNKEMYLSDSICDVTYQSGGNMSRIVSTVAGNVRLNGKNWEVVEKVKVVIG